MTGRKLSSYSLKATKDIINNSRFVPASKPILSDQICELQTFFNKSGRLLCMTGAGISTESGIPDYRSEGVGLYARTNRRPVQYQDFIKSHQNRQRYWARNFTGWPQFASFQPNSSHLAISNWEKGGKLDSLVTQNVDALHTKAGNENVTELHGCTHRVVCLSCDFKMGRWELQDLFHDLNPTWDITSTEIAPDGDVLIPDEKVKSFEVPPCPKCDGILKPDVIFFGDNVNRNLVSQVFQKVEECDSLLICGSSLFVYSGYRFAVRAAEKNIPIAIVNIGETRADNLATLKIDAKCGDVIPKISLS